MAKSRGQWVFEKYEQLPDSIRKHTDKAIRISAKATKRIRDKKQIETKGKAWVSNQRRKLRI